MIIGLKFLKRTLPLLFGILSLQTAAGAWAGTESVSASVAKPALSLEQLGALLAMRPNRYATFEELQFSHLLNRPIKLRGTLTFKAPDKLEKRVTAPSDERFVVDGDFVLYENKTKRIYQSLSLENYPLLRALAQSLTATFSGDFHTLGRFYLLDLRGHINQWILTLTPVQGPLRTVIESIVIQGRDDTITRFDLRETTGDHSQIHIVESQ